MKRSNRHKKFENEKNVTSKDESLDSDEEQHFSNWYGTIDGIDCLKIFVVINSIVVFSTLAWPSIQKWLNEIYPLRCVLFLSIMFWYTITVWNFVDENFSEQFKKYLSGQRKPSVQIDTKLKQNDEACKVESRQLSKDKFLLSMKDTCTILEYNNEM
ncbi:hypothetical protein FQA39_LY08260 [Lamprigera yunnana]|nr:hypothetical protein FQA39_LY08260 [Lamprigera yunnana]